MTAFNTSFNTSLSTSVFGFTPAMWTICAQYNRKYAGATLLVILSLFLAFQRTCAVQARVVQARHTIHTDIPGGQSTTQSTSQRATQPANTQHSAASVKHSTRATLSTGATLKNDVLQYVNPFIGTGGHGHTYPGATVPFGMVQLSPDNGTDGWDWCSGYHASDSIIVGFSHTHISGTGIGDLLDVSIMPMLGVPNLLRREKDSASSKTRINRKAVDWAAQYTHANETASPGYYRVLLKPLLAAPSTRITAELTVNQWAGVHKYSFANATMATIVIDLSFAVNWDKTTDALIQVQNNRILTGYRFSEGWARKQTVYFALEFSKPFVERVGTDDTIALQRDFAALTGVNTRAYFRFPISAGEPLIVKVGISSASVEGALQSLKTVQPKTFEQVRDNAEQLWRQELSKINVSTLTHDDRVIFYTALYHSFLAPVLHSDVLGEYKTPAHDVATAKNYQRYDTFSLWDTFRAVHPLFTLVQQSRVNDMIQSMLAHYREFGVLPVWSFVGNETKTMTGYHAVPVIVDAYLKGFRAFHPDTAFAAIKASAEHDTLPVNLYRRYGFVPHDKDGFSVTKTLEYAYDDWCVLQMARALGNKDDSATFAKRAQNYRNVFDPDTRFARPRLADRTWKEPFDPRETQARFEFEFAEGNAWQYSWFVPHDLDGLVKVHGGRDRFLRMLDSLFNQQDTLTGDDRPIDVSGLIGQYAHGNEPCHHIPYLYAAIGEPSRTQARVRQIIRTFYKPTREGLCGNDDCGQMSAWLVFSMLGFYPLNPVGGEYVIGAPLVRSATLTTSPKNKPFRITATNLSERNLYVKSATLNGKPLQKPILRHADILAGGELVFEMSDQPSMLWKAK